MTCRAAGDRPRFYRDLLPPRAYLSVLRSVAGESMAFVVRSPQNNAAVVDAAVLGQINQNLFGETAERAAAADGAVNI